MVAPVDGNRLPVDAQSSEPEALPAVAVATPGDAAAPLMTPSAFAERVGVSRQAVSKAIKVGRVPAYDANGLQVDAGYRGKKFVRFAEAASAFAMNLARVDEGRLDAVDEALTGKQAPDQSGPDAQKSDGSLTRAKRDREELNAELLRIRLGRERGDLVDKAAVDSAFEAVGREVNRAVMFLPSIAEELVSAVHRGGEQAVREVLRTKATAICEGIAVKLTIDHDGSAGDGDEIP